MSGIWSLFGILTYAAFIFLFVLVVYTLILAIKALRIYISKNSQFLN